MGDVRRSAAPTCLIFVFVTFVLDLDLVFDFLLEDFEPTFRGARSHPPDVAVSHPHSSVEPGAWEAGTVVDWAAAVGD